MKGVKSLIKTLFKLYLIVLIFTFVSFATSWADQCSLLSKEQVTKASNYLKEDITIYEFCPPCGDTSPKAIIIRDVQIQISQLDFLADNFEIAVNHKKIDLAYIYVPDSTGKYVNLALISGCSAIDVPKYLPQISLIPSVKKKQEDFSTKKEVSKIDISVEVWPELFPVLAKFIAEGNKHFDIPGLVKWRLHNKGDETVKVTVTSEIPEWTPPAIKMMNLDPSEHRELMQTPFGNNLLVNHSIVPGTLILRVKVADKTIYEETKNIKIRAADDMIWSLYRPWDMEYLIAAWVTPKDPSVEQILTIAKEKIYGRSLQGYIRKSKEEVKEEIRAIFNAVRDIGVSYVSSTVNFGQIGFTQRVRLPRESIEQRMANCIDGTVLLASLFENIGLEPLIIFVPGHAFVGVRLAPGSQETLFIETTLIGRPVEESIFSLEFTFDAAVREGNTKYAKAYYESLYNQDALHIVDIKKARELGIYPLW